LGGHLSDIDKKKICVLYEDRLRKFGLDVKTVGWGTVESQYLRFDMLVRGIDLNCKSILDIGCGLGDLVSYLDANNIHDYSYRGIDISGALITEAKKRFHGRENIHFETSDLLDLSPQPVDIVLISGALSFRVEDNIAWAQCALEKMFHLCREAVSVNFLTSYVDYVEEKNFHYSPETMFAFARNLTKYVCLYHDYRLWEFTLQLFHQPKGRNDGNCGQDY